MMTGALSRHGEVLRGERRGSHPGPPVLTSLICLALVNVSESPETPVDPAAFGEG
jgi:hypothetical protein